ncbi:MAG: PstS family phosphate ABC transporter substrate-binding protein, partial [Candidatus Micrarchaeota archaeon]|nr:PstS family phosphate ABC transporter substrate-binding protein [Candidatus Micrarchaeota archaeon]
MRNAVVGFAAAVLLLLLFLAFGCARAEEGKDRQVKITGSDTMVVLVQALAEEYMRENPQKRISVSGGGSGVGIAALQSKSTDIAMSSRDMKASEIEAAKANGVFPKRIAIAYDGISIFVHPSNPVNELSVEQLRAIFKGEIKNWKEVGGPDAPISPYSRESSSGTYDFVKEHVLGGADYAPNTKYIAGSALLVESVSQDKTGIGYTGVAYTRQDNRVKIL